MVFRHLLPPPHAYRLSRAQTLGMFVGMCMALPVYWIHSAMNRRKAGYESIQDSGAAPPPAVTWSTILALAIPSLFDLAATALCMFGLGYVSVSVYQMLRGGAIVFVAILKHTYLGGKLASFQWAGVALTAISIVLVGASAGGGDDASGDKNPLVGVGLILMGALVQARHARFVSFCLCLFPSHASLLLFSSVARFVSFRLSRALSAARGRAEPTARSQSSKCACAPPLGVDPALGSGSRSSTRSRRRWCRPRSARRRCS